MGGVMPLVVPSIHLSDDQRGALIAACVALILAVLGFVTSMFKKLQELTNKMDTNHTTLESVKTQVVNDHSTNLRDDMDKLHDAMMELKDGLDGERHYRSQNDGRLEEKVSQNSQRIASLEGKLDWLKEGVGNGTQ